MTKEAEREGCGLPPFVPVESYERLLVLREADARAFLLRTSEATRLALAHYERWRASSRPSGEAPRADGRGG